MEFNYDMIEQQESANNQGSEEENEVVSSMKTSNKHPQQPVNQPKQETIKTKKRETLTPEKLAELKRKFPEIDWEADTVAMEGINGMADSVDVVSPALRVGGR